MSTVNTLLKNRDPLPPVRLLTAAELAEFSEELPSPYSGYELDNGVLVMMMRPSFRHGTLQARLTGYLFAMGEQLGYGKVITEPGIILWRNPDRVVGPDIAFFERGIFPLHDTREGYLETMPSIVVEIRSKNQSRPYVDRKASDYLAAGVLLVWIVDPEASQVIVMRPDQEEVVLSASATLTAEPFIPGFQLPLADLFKE